MQRDHSFNERQYSKTKNSRLKIKNWGFNSLVTISQILGSYGFIDIRLDGNYAAVC